MNATEYKEHLANHRETFVISQLWEWLDRYSDHKKMCEYWRYMVHGDCDCGLTAILQLRRG